MAGAGGTAEILPVENTMVAILTGLEWPVLDLIDVGSIQRGLAVAILTGLEWPVLGTTRPRISNHLAVAILTGLEWLVLVLSHLAHLRRCPCCDPHRLGMAGAGSRALPVVPGSA